jgi:hypothetical protein
MRSQLRTRSLLSPIAVSLPGPQSMWSRVPGSRHHPRDIQRFATMAKRCGPTRGARSAADDSVSIPRKQRERTITGA